MPRRLSESNSTRKEGIAGNQSVITRRVSEGLRQIPRLRVGLGERSIAEWSFVLAVVSLITSFTPIECSDAADKKSPSPAGTKSTATPAPTSKSPDKPETSSKKPPEKHVIHNFMTVCDG